MADFPRIDQKKGELIEHRLDELNNAVSGLFEEPGVTVQHPIIFIVGHQRCGATLVSQFLTSYLHVGYPSNLVARFWRAPLVGIAVQNALADTLGPYESSFTSELGTTPTLLGPHEFSYFWNEWFPDQQRCRDGEALQCVLGNMERAFDAPLVFKNIFNALRVAALAALFPTAIFVPVHRNPLDVACSTLNARRKRFGRDDAWLGVRPSRLGDVTELSPYEQIARQVVHTEIALTVGLAGLRGDRLIETSYEEFCRAPKDLAAKLESRGIRRRDASASVPEFQVSRPSKDHPDADGLLAALRVHFPDLT